MINNQFSLPHLGECTLEFGSEMVKADHETAHCITAFSGRLNDAFPQHSSEPLEISKTPKCFTSLSWRLSQRRTSQRNCRGPKFRPSLPWPSWLKTTREWMLFLLKRRWLSSSMETLTSWHTADLKKWNTRFLSGTPRSPWNHFIIVPSVLKQQYKTARLQEAPALRR